MDVSRTYTLTYIHIVICTFYYAGIKHLRRATMHRNTPKVLYEIETTIPKSNANNKLTAQPLGGWYANNQQPSKSTSLSANPQPPYPQTHPYSSHAIYSWQWVFMVARRLTGGCLVWCGDATAIRRRQSPVTGQDMRDLVTEWNQLLHCRATVQSQSGVIKTFVHI